MLTWLRSAFTLKEPTPYEMGTGLDHIGSRLTARQALARLRFAVISAHAALRGRAEEMELELWRAKRESEGLRRWERDYIARIEELEAEARWARAEIRELHGEHCACPHCGPEREEFNVWTS